MSLTFVASSTLANCTPTDGCINEANNTYVIVESNLPSLRVFNTSLVQQVSSSISASPIGVCMLNTASAVMVSTSVTTVDFIEIATGYSQTVSGGAHPVTTSSTSKGQYVAADTSLGVAFAQGSGGNTVGQVVKITASPQAVSLITLSTYDENMISVILKQPGQWLVSGQYGNIYQIDQFGNIQDFCAIRNLMNAGQYKNVTQAINPWNMSYDNNMLLVSSDCGIFLIDWSTKTLLKTIAATPAGTTATPWLICQGSSGVTAAAYINGSQNGQQTVYEMDYTINPVSINSRLYLDSASNTVTTLALGASGYGFYLDSGARMRSFQCTPRGSTTRTVTVQESGVNENARLIVLNDTNGLGESYVVLDTMMTSPATYRVPTGQTLMEIVKVGNGSTALFDVSRYST